MTEIQIISATLAAAVISLPSEGWVRKDAAGGGSSYTGCGHHAQALAITLDWARRGKPKEQARHLWQESEPGQHGCEDFTTVYDGAIRWLEARKLEGNGILNTIQSDRDDTPALEVKNAVTTYDPSWMPPILSPFQAETKYHDEMDPHWLSRDWRTAAKDTRDFYQLFAERYARSKDGIDINSPWLDGHDPAGAARRWLSSQKHPLIAVYYNKLVMLADVQGKPAKDNPDSNRIGRNWTTERLCKHIKRILVAAGESGKRIADSRVAAIMNTDEYRKDHGVEDLRSVKRLTVLRVRKLLEENGEIHQVKKEERFRSNHHWCNLPAMWAEGPSASYSAPLTVQAAKFRVFCEEKAVLDTWYKEACRA